MRGWRNVGTLLCCLLAVVPLGCGDVPTPEPTEPRTSFDAHATGSITGQVLWSGPAPSVAPILCPADAWLHIPRREFPNPNAPRIDKAGGVGQAVVFLRGVAASRSRPWDHPPVRVVLNEEKIEVQQGNIAAHLGFVRSGQAIEMVSSDQRLHALRAGGAAFFTLPFPDPDQPLSRKLEKKGLVELSSATGYYWTRAYLFVDDHPYYALTSDGGRFELANVPVGEYDLVCWIPAWEVVSHDRDPETSRISRLKFGAPLECVQRVSVKTGSTQAVNILISAP